VHILGFVDIGLTRRGYIGRCSGLLRSAVLVAAVVVIIIVFFFSR
jgi:hypothetical protein